MEMEKKLASQDRVINAGFGYTMFIDTINVLFTVISLIVIFAGSLIGAALWRLLLRRGNVAQLDERLLQREKEREQNGKILVGKNHRNL